MDQTNFPLEGYSVKIMIMMMRPYVKLQNKFSFIFFLGSIPHILLQEGGKSLA